MLVHCQQNLSMECAVECKAAASKMRLAKKRLSQEQQAMAPQSYTVSRQLFVLVTVILSAVLFVVVCFAFHQYTLLAKMRAV